MKKIYIIILSAILLQSCNSFLDLQPKGYTIPTTYDDFWQLMNYAQMYKAQENYPVYLTDDALLSSGDLAANYTNTEDHVKALYSFAHGDVFSGGQDDYFWSLSYNRIYTCNVVINNVMNSKDGNDNDKKRLQAEAKVARAFEYLSMIGMYSPAYNEATAASDYGLPLNYSEDIGTMSYTRNTVAEVYDAIKKDLDEALPFLPDKAKHSFKASKSVAYGFLARMYLMQGNYEKALENSVLSLKVSSDLLNLNDYTVLEDRYIGRVVKKSDMQTNFPDGKNNVENIFARYAPYVYGNVLQVHASEDLLNVFAKDLPKGAVDKRLAMFFSKDKFVYDSFPGYTLYCAFIYVNVGLSNPEVLLTAAECYARRGAANDLVEASRLYNILRDNRLENNTHVQFTNKDEALLKVLEERRREFAMVGSIRLVDLKRLNKDPKFAKTLTHTADGKTWQLEPNDLRYTMPLPPVVKNFRPDLPDYKR